MSTVEYIPYTYLLGWSSENKWYYGSEYGEKSKIANPSNLWKSYFTSSKTVKKFTENFGDPDIILIRKTFSTKISCILWEGKVLRRLNKKDPFGKNSKWLNRTTNRGFLHTEEEHEKRKETYRKKYGVDTPLLSEAVSNKYKKTCLDRYGVNNPMQNKKVKEKIKENNLIKYGVDHWTKTETWKKENSGRVMTEETKVKTKQTSMLRYGVENYNQLPELKSKKKKLAEEWNKNMPRLICKHCRKAASKGNFVRWHGDNCRLK